MNELLQEASAATGNMTIAVFNPEELAPLIEAIPKSRPMAQRLVEYLGENPHAPTADVYSAVAVDNISREANAANRKLYFLGYMIGCMRPTVLLKNRFYQDTPQHLWSLYKLPQEPVLKTEFSFLTVKLSKQDAKRFKRAADDNGFTNQSGLIEAINRVMVEWNQSPVTDHGSAGKK